MDSCSSDQDCRTTSQQIFLLNLFVNLLPRYTVKKCMWYQRSFFFVFWTFIYRYNIPISVLLLFNMGKLLNMMQLIFWLMSSTAGCYDLVKSGSASKTAENPRVYFLVLWVVFYPYNLKLIPERKNWETS